MQVNGIEKNIDNEVTLMQYLSNEGYKTERIVVEINGAIISKSNYENVILNKNDLIEIINFVGGGWETCQLKKRKRYRQKKNLKK